MPRLVRSGLPLSCFCPNSASATTRERMAKFDPWPIFFKREWKRNWPFLVGFATTGTIVTKLHLSLTEEDAKNSPYMQRLRR